MNQTQRAAMIRAMAGLAERGPELGVDPFGSFQAGLGGAIGFGERQQQNDYEQQRINLANRELERRYINDGTGDQRYGVMPWYMNPGVPEQTRAAYQSDALYHGQPSAPSDPYASTQSRLRAEYDFLRNNPQARSFGVGGANPAPAPRQMSPWQAAQVRSWIAQHPGSTEDDAIAAMTYNRPVIVGGEMQARDEFGPLFVVPRGVDPHTAIDMRTGRPYEPMMIQTQRRFGVPGQQGAGAPDSSGLGRFVR